MGVSPCCSSPVVAPCPAGETQSEGGFAPNRVSAASILGIGSTTDKKGKEYYTYDILTRTGEHDC